MHEQLWAGVGLKLDHASFHFERMRESRQLPENSPTNVALQSSGAIIGAGWQRPLFAYLDAFLLTARSVPEIINCCFGCDTANKAMEIWFDCLPPDEQCRRKNFSRDFKNSYDAFKKLPLSTARNVSAHRRGFPDVTVTINGMWGVLYEGSPIEHIPSTETREADIPEAGFLMTPLPLRPHRASFQIEGQDLFEACQEYFDAASKLRGDAQAIAVRVHGNKAVTSPPST